MYLDLKRFSTPVLVSLSVVFGALAVQADEAETNLLKIVEIYGKLSSYADSGQVQVVTSDGKTTEPQTARTLFQRPDRLKVEAEDIRMSLSDKKLTTVMDTLQTTLELPVPKLPEADELLVGPLGSALLGSSKGQPQAIVLHLLLDQKPAQWLTREGKPTMDQPEEWSGKKWNRLKVDRPLRPDWVIWYDPQSYMIGRLDVVSGQPDRKSASVRWIAGTVKMEELPQTTWSLDVPANYASVDKKVAGFQMAAAEKKKKPDSELVGKPAGDFPLEFIGADGKTRMGKLSEFKGKPILIDFWATWCGPCRKSFPELTQALATLDGDSDLQVLLVSIDQKAEEGELSDFVRLGLKKMGIDIEKLPRTLLAMDRTSAAAKAYKVEAIPMTVMIDRTGTIRKVHVGVTPTTTLRKDIAELMK